LLSQGTDLRFLEPLTAKGDDNMTFPHWTRRELLAAVGAVGLGGAAPAFGAGEPPPETTHIRLLRHPFDVTCLSPMWVAEELLRAEGFDDVSYVPLSPEQYVSVGVFGTVAAGGIDVAMADIFGILPALDAGKQVVALAGIHPGCFELFGAKTLRSIIDLKGKSIAVSNFGRRAFVSAMLAHVGLDPRKDVTFVESREGVRLLAEGKVDAVLGFPPEPQLMREQNIGVSLLNTTIDRPWSQYFCCMAFGNRDFVAKNPVATKRALRALLKAAEQCAAEPERVVRTLVDRGFYKESRYSAQVLREIPYKRWREYDSADSLRFYALRLHEGGLIKSNPQKLLAQGTNWRFIEQLKKEMKT
jgi:NitT/TauT family transport system substrate-binding protein